MSEHGTLKDEIKDLVNILDDPDWENYPLKRKIQIITLELLEAACVIAHGLDPDDADADLDGIIKSAEELFDEYIEPIDLPVGNFIEGFVDASIRRGIRPAIISYVAWIK